MGLMPPIASMSGRVPASAVKDQPRSLPLTERVYENLGNLEVVEQINPTCMRVLDVGCGAGDNAELLKARMPRCEIFGITRSQAEADRARDRMVECWVDDIEDSVPAYLRPESFDCVIFSHVLEHLRNPAAVVSRFASLVRDQGQIVMAVPNVMFYKMRIQFIRGDFEYQPTGGILDDTHLHFYTWFTADRYLLAESPELHLVCKMVSGRVPLPRLRGRVIPHTWAKEIDQWGLRHWPNLFGYQIVIAARRQKLPLRP